MKKHIRAIILDDETIVIDGRTLHGKDEVADALRSALQIDPDFLLVIDLKKKECYQGIGTVIYTSQRVGVPSENLRFLEEDGKVVTFAQLRSRPAEPLTE